jgi:hypothetical protein
LFPVLLDLDEVRPFFYPSALLPNAIRDLSGDSESECFPPPDA